MAILPINLSTIALGTGGFVIHGQDGGDRSGYSVAWAGDVNGDGFDDLIIGAPRGDAAGNLKSDAGDSYVVFGKSGGFGATIDLGTIAAGTGGFVILGRDAADESGRSVASAGDVNGDGFDDLIIGAPLGDAASNGAADAGDSYVVFGKSGGFGAAIDLCAIAAGTGGFVILGRDAGDQSGRSVASAGDVNGDGFDDLVVGAPEAEVSLFAQGESYVIFGKADGFGAAIDASTLAGGTGGFAILGQGITARSGYSAASAGDVNGDGLDDLIIGAFGFSGSGAAIGASYVVFGRTSGFAASIQLSAIAAGSGGFVILGEDAQDQSGFSVASAGDVNGDGFGDLVIGARNADADLNAKQLAGGSYVVFGKSSGFGASVNLSAIAAGSGGFVIHGQDEADFSGRSVASAGDVNGDGFDDLIIGANRADGAGNSRTGAGDSFVVFGKAGGFGPAVDLVTVAAGTGGFVIHGQDSADESGFTVSSGGDINGDGFDDLIVGAPYADAAGNAKSDAGGSYVIFGRDFQNTVTHAGTSAAETLTGTGGADTMVGGLGDDILQGNGGADVLIGGAGDDVLRISSLGFARAMGGSGTDTLALMGSGMTLNLAAIGNTKLQDIERIDLTGTGNNTLRLSMREVLNLSSSSNTLRVLGNAGDAMSFGIEAWTRAGEAGGFIAYTNGQARVEMASAVTIVFEPMHLSEIALGTGGFVMHGQELFDYSGWSVASAGDVNGDGFDDLILGARGGDAAANGKSSAGESYVVFGTSGGFVAAIDLSNVAAGTGGFVIHGQDGGDGSGSSVASAGDVNGDGFGDLIIGAPLGDAAGNLTDLAGDSYVVFGKDGGFGAVVDLTAVAAGIGGFVIRGQDQGDNSGFSVASAGDINGDGFDDLIIGAPLGDGAGNATTQAGESYVVFGRSGGFGAEIELSTVAGGTGGFVIRGQDANDQSGFAVASAGDINSDGFDDLVIGAYLADADGNSKGSAGGSYVVFGKSGGFAAAIDLAGVAGGTGGFVIHGQDAGDQAGFSVASAGDINGDGFGDIVIGARYGDAAGNAKGSAGDNYVVFGKSGGFGAAIDLVNVAAGSGGFVIHGPDEFDTAGWSVASAGDVNGDGFDDLIIGARYGYGADKATVSAGDSYVVFGKAGGFGASIDLTSVAAGSGGFVIHGQDESDAAGLSVAAAGDVNGDGFDDLLVGAPSADGAGNASASAGDSYLIFGRDFLHGLTHAGTSAAETLAGTAGADRMVGGLGNDILIGAGGADVLIGGAGDDVLRVSDLGFARAMGGSGTDTLALAGSGMALNLAAIADTKLQDIERIDLTGTGNNTLQITALEVLNLSSTSNTLRVLGNAGDSVAFGDAGWVAGANAGGFTPWSNGQARLEIADGVLPCYAPGTRIATPFGWRAVETLLAGDAVLTADGAAQVLTWAGAWETDAADPAQRAVRIRAHAFGRGRPARDLVVSPSHALWLEGVLVPAVALLDGVRVVREAAPVRYHHVALVRHGVILAEDLPAETFCPLGEGRYADAPAVAHPLPRLEEGPALEALRARLGLAPRPEAGPAEGFLERVLAVPGGIVVEGWASGPADLAIEAAGRRIPVLANRWRIDLDRAGLAAGGFRQFLPVAAQGVRVLRGRTGVALPALD